MALTAIEVIKGSKGRHPMTRCICDCGRERIVRSTKLRRGLVTMCAICAKQDAAKRGAETRRKWTPDELAIADRYSVYKANANKKGFAFEISMEFFFSITAQPCAYCGTTEKIGIDRIESSTGYLYGNCAPCCADCNYAKRNLSRESFLALVERIHAYQRR